MFRSKFSYFLQELRIIHSDTEYQKPPAKKSFIEGLDPKPPNDEGPVGGGSAGPMKSALGGSAGPMKLLLGGRDGPIKLGSGAAGP